MRKYVKSVKIKEKICQDFYPNCRYCTCFSECFPDNALNDVFSEILVVQKSV